MTSGKYFNRGVMTLDSPYIGHVVRETEDKIVVFGSFGYRFDVSKSKIKEVGRNVILNMDVDELIKYKVDRDAALPTGEPIEKLAMEQ
jgi:hypothetical protein